MARSTAHRLLGMLVHRGFAVQDPATRAYRPGPQETEIGLGAVGMAVLDSGDRPAAGFTVAGPMRRMTQGYILAIARELRATIAGAAAELRKSAIDKVLTPIFSNVPWRLNHGKLLNSVYENQAVTYSPGRGTKLISAHISPSGRYR